MDKFALKAQLKRYLTYIFRIIYVLCITCSVYTLLLLQTFMVYTFMVLANGDINRHTSTSLLLYTLLYSTVLIHLIIY